MENNPKPIRKSRFGFHYFPDADHYRESDLRAWLPELSSLGASWLALYAPPDRAIPEAFLRGLMDAGIEPLLHFQLPLNAPNQPEELTLLFETYARWGVQYAILFDRPNRRKAWSSQDWAQKDLVERFIDLFIPVAETALQAGLIPVFPPLEPGGDYWDTAFLRTALQALKRRGHRRILQRLILGAYARPGNRLPDYGAGGPERWPGARPYFNPPEEEDQRGFRIFDWYLTLSRAVLGAALPVILLGTGYQLGDQCDPELPEIEEASHVGRNLALLQLLGSQQVTSITQGAAEPVQEEVIAGIFWLLAAPDDKTYSSAAWFKSDGQAMPVVGAVRQWLSEGQVDEAKNGEPHKKRILQGDPRPIAHYLLLPTYDWGIADWHLEVIQPFIKNRRPTTGFSLVEAAQATHVTVIGSPQEFPEEALDDLRAAGCIVERIDGDGTSIATQLAQT
jgi:hypothetical protein